MKKLFLLFILSFSLFAVGENIFPKIEKIDDVNPWWLNEVSPVEGVIGGIGIISLDSKNFKKEAVEAAKKEIFDTKNNYSESEIKFNNNSTQDIYTDSKTQNNVKALLIDSWQDEEYYYVWMGELLNKTAYNKLKAYILKKNEEIRENRIDIIKYNGKIIVTAKDGGQITINKGKNDGIKVNEVFNIYRLTDESVNLLSNEVEDFSKKKIGEIVMKEVFSNSSRGEASLIGNFKIQVGDVAYPTNHIFKVSSKKNFTEEEISKYNYDLNYIPKLMNIERARSLSKYQYSLKLMTDFDSSKMESNIGLFKALEVGLSYDFNNDNSLVFMGKFGVPVNRDSIAGLAYEKNLNNGLEYLIGLFEYQYGYGVADINYRSPLGNTDDSSSLGGSIQLQPSSSFIFGIEYSDYLETDSSNQFTLKLNLKVMDEFWFGSGITWSDERRYFIAVQHLNIF